MNINTLIAHKGVTKYRVAKQAGIPQTTMTDICSGKARIENCSGETIYKLAKTLDVSMEILVADAMEYRPTFETFKSNVCHLVKDMGDIEFLIDTLESGRIRELWDKKWYAESLYLLAMTDYLSRENDLPPCADYNDLRRAKLTEIIYPAGVLTLCAATGGDAWKERSRAEAIPEFLRHNIVEAEVRNVV
ncbi:MAG: helix-turn-helix transcriptional regulator [Oscillospiraceae bacterium]|jgi:transcriptional regulator with XRE-family HTH domain|nr:helix-turn-helix transcriptional regulator [Oscillospiraceae bacterium]